MGRTVQVSVSFRFSKGLSLFTRASGKPETVWLRWFCVRATDAPLTLQLYTLVREGVPGVVVYDFPDLNFRTRVDYRCSRCHSSEDAYFRHILHRFRTLLTVPFLKKETRITFDDCYIVIILSPISNGVRGVCVNVSNVHGMCAIIVRAAVT
jgi:hypothetical protein